jgi:hypothetical protein
MKRYDVEIIHEPSGEYLNYSFESDDEDLDIYKEFIRDISVVVINEEEVEDDELDTDELV